MSLSRKKILALGVALITSFGILAAGCGGDTKKDDAKKTAAPASDGIQKIKDRGVLKVGVKVDVPKFGFKDPKTGKIEGFEIDLSKAIAKKILGDENKIDLTGVVAKTRGPLLDSGEIDLCIATFTITDERKQTYNMTTPYYEDPVGFLVKKDSGIKSLKDLNGKNIAVPQGATTRKGVQDAADQAGIQVNFIEFPTYSECKTALSAGRADAYAMDTSNLLGYRDDATELLPDKIAPQLYGAATKKDNKALFDLVEKTFEDMKKSGEMDQLLKKWDLK